MPELPEVETIRLGLQEKLPGQTIADVQIDWQKSFQIPSVMLSEVETSNRQIDPSATARDDVERAVADCVIGQEVTSLERKGKVLIINLQNDYSLLVHLKMTGQLVLVEEAGGRLAGGHPTGSMRQPLPDNSTRVFFTFASGDRLFFNDQRKFGWIKLVPRAEIVRDPLVQRLGPEPLSKQFTLEGLNKEFKSHARAPIKAVILDQSTVSGIGNIYADESLHLAKIHPARLAGTLNAAEAKALHKAIPEIISIAIKAGGTSMANYVNALGGKGDYLEHARVFNRQGQPCYVCGSTIEKIRVAGRGTHFCPKCQELK